MRTAILSLILFFFAGCTITTYQYPEPLIIDHRDPVRVVVYPYQPPIHYNYYRYRVPTLRRTMPVRRHNGVRVHRKNYWSKTTKHPQQSERMQRNKRNKRNLPESFKKRLQERRKNWQEKRKSSKDR